MGIEVWRIFLQVEVGSGGVETGRQRVGKGPVRVQEVSGGHTGWRGADETEAAAASSGSKSLTQRS